MGLNCFSCHEWDEYNARYKEHSPDELKWLKLQPFLLHRGYKLRPRYQPDWKPSWEKPRFFGQPMAIQFEDSLSNCFAGIIDAVRIADGAEVVIKRFDTWRPELRLLQKLNSAEMRADRRNKTVPVLDLLLAPDTDEVAFVVMPKLMEFVDIPFQFVDEVFDALSQYLNTMAFLHEHHIAHMDACSGNLMMDVNKVVPTGFHLSRVKKRPDGRKPIQYTSRRAVGNVDYYIIDFGISQDLSPANGRFGTKFYASWGQDKTIPEWNDKDTKHDPFKVDICQLGNVFKRIVTHYEGLTVLQPIVTAMTTWNPEDRPTAVDACKQLCDIRASLTDTQLADRIFYKAADQRLRKRLVQGKSPPELMDPELLFPEWFKPKADISSATSGTNESKP